MLAAAFLVTVVVALGGYHILVERPRRAEAARLERQAHAGPAPLKEMVTAVPAGVFLQNGFTWSRLVPDGAVEVGIHPMLSGLVGKDLEFSLDDPGTRVERGEPFLTIGRAARAARIRAPLSGRITARNHYPPDDGRIAATASEDDSWLYRIEPDDLAREVPAWMIGTQAEEWSRDRYARIREHLQHAVAGGDTGLALADGGEVPFGALAELDAEAWAEFESTFLTS